MCGIIGLLNSCEVGEFSKEQLTALHQTATELAQSIDSKVAESIEKKLKELERQLETLPSFEVSFALGQNLELRSEFEQIKRSLNQLLQVSQEGQKQSREFSQIERWNRILRIGRDLQWRIERDLLEPQEELYKIVPPPWKEEDRHKLRAYWELEFTLRGLQRLEIRGRDSGGLSFLVKFPSREAFEKFLDELKERELFAQWKERSRRQKLTSGSICGVDTAINSENPAIAFVYKEASEIGSIGQNIAKLRREYREDKILELALSTPEICTAPLAHTRWASNGIINIENTHPQGDNTASDSSASTKLFAVLNGDIDNFDQLLQQYMARNGKQLPPGVTTDAKIIPLLVSEIYEKTGDLREAFRQALLQFRGSFAIALQHLEYPDKVYLGIGGSGQSLYVGIHPRTTLFASELYGVVEATPYFIKMDGEKERVPGNPSTRGQIVELDRSKIGEEYPISAWSFDGTPLGREELPIQRAEITTRDIDIAGYPHFFLKEISESVDSVRKTLQGRFFFSSDPANPFSFRLDESVVPSAIVEKLKSGQIKNIYCIGQGTAAVAAMGVAEALKTFLGEEFKVIATKATELSGYMLRDKMDDSLIIAVSQSGTTTDTNRTVDLVRRRGAPVLSILNRRNSDLSFKSDGIIYTSDGRDIEMSVASTKAFYSQITAGILLAIFLAYRLGKLDVHRTYDELKELTEMPDLMSRALALGEQIKEIASKFALRRRYWAVVGSGHNQISAQEIRIKLSELCYKSISYDTIEDKKHIDLSAEPLRIVCATSHTPSVLSDIVKEVAIFKAHRSLPIVIASERDKDRFKPYAAAVIPVPDAPPHLAPILSTIAGHLFGYYAARAIDQQSIALREVRRELLNFISKTAESQNGERKKSEENLKAQLEKLLNMLKSPLINSTLEVNTAVQLAILGTKLYRSVQTQLEGEPPSEFPFEEANYLLNYLTMAIRELSRPIDAIKHQAKTVTVGISRQLPTLRGALGEIFKELQLDVGNISWRNLSYLIAAEPLIRKVTGATLYKVHPVDENGRPLENSQIFKLTSWGIASDIPSRTDTDHQLRGSKWLALKEDKVQIGIGRSDKRKIAIIPMSGDSKDEAKILLLHIEFDDSAGLKERLEFLRLRPKFYDQLRAAVTELGIFWSDQLLLQVPVEVLFDESPDRFIEHQQARTERK